MDRLLDSFTFLELAKFKKTKDELTSIIDRWSYFFKHAQETSEKDLQQIVGKDPIIERAYEELNQFSWSEEELRSYEAEIKREMDNQAVQSKQISIKLAKRYNDGLLVGEARGEAKNAKNIAKKMLKEGIEINLIAKFTNLSIEEIKKL
jgi:predicted transposase/invertase (TIGR01784 family)